MISRDDLSNQFFALSLGDGDTNPPLPPLPPRAPPQKKFDLVPEGNLSPLFPDNHPILQLHHRELNVLALCNLNSVNG